MSRVSGGVTNWHGSPDRRRVRATCANCGYRQGRYDVNRDGVLIVECERCGCTTIEPRQVRRVRRAA
jgi:hypothetical protein